MQKDTRTKQKIHPSSLCKRMEFTLPEGWRDLSQEQLERVLRMLWLYSSSEDTFVKVKTALLMYFCNIEVDSSIGNCFLCREKESGNAFLLHRELLPDMVARLDWLDHPENMDVRIEKVGEYTAVDFNLRELMFGDYLICENFYQAYLITNNEELLVKMASVLYHVAEGSKTIVFQEHILLGVLMWWMAAKKVLSEWFPNFLKPAEGAGEAVTRETLVESMRVQLRLLTKGDVTKEEYIKTHVDTWTAMAELDAQAREAEEIKRKYGK